MQMLIHDYVTNGRTYSLSTIWDIAGMRVRILIDYGVTAEVTSWVWTPGGWVELDSLPWLLSKTSSNERGGNEEVIRRAMGDDEALMVSRAMKILDE